MRRANVILACVNGAWPGTGLYGAAAAPAFCRIAACFIACACACA